MKNILMIIFFKFTIGILNTASATQIEQFSLKVAYDAALRIDPIIKSSKYNEAATKENITIAQSRFLPQISIQGTTNQINQTTTQELTSGGELTKTFAGPTINHQLFIRQSLIKPKDLIAISFAENQLKVAELKYQLDLKDLWHRVVNASIELVGANQISKVLHKSLYSMKVIVDQELIRFEKGEGTRDAVIEAEAQYQSAYATYNQAIQNLNSKQFIFKSLTQIDLFGLNKFKLPLYPSSQLIEIERQQVWDNILKESKEVKIAKLQVNMQTEKLKMTAAEHMPTLDFLAGINYAKNDVTSTQGYKYKNKQFGVQYSIPIYFGGAITATERQATLGLEASISDSEALVKKIESDFIFNWTNIIGLQARLIAGKFMIESAQEQVHATKLANMQGVKTLIEIANAESNLSKRIVDQINYSVDLHKFHLKLNKNEILFSLFN